jgi:hypothetical protein
VIVEDIDAQGKISLKPIGEEWAVPEGQADEAGGDRRPREGGGGRDRGGRGSGGGGGGDRGSSSGGGGGDRNADRRGRRFRDDRPAQGADAGTETAPAPDAG